MEPYLRPAPPARPRRAQAAQRPESLAKRSAMQRTHKQAIQNWKPSDLPYWLTRDVYVERVQPALASVAKSRIRSALGVSEPYSSAIQAGKRVPHPRHWQALAQIVGVSAVANTRGTLDQEAIKLF